MVELRLVSDPHDQLRVEYIGWHDHFGDIHKITPPKWPLAQQHQTVAPKQLCPSPLRISGDRHLDERLMGASEVDLVALLESLRPHRGTSRSRQLGLEKSGSSARIGVVGDPARDDVERDRPVEFASKPFEACGEPTAAEELRSVRLSGGGKGFAEQVRRGLPEPAEIVAIDLVRQSGGGLEQRPGERLEHRRTPAGGQLV